MASIPGQMGIAVVKQPTPGVLAPTLPDGSATVDLAAGAILGDPESGQMESGIGLTLGRVSRPRGNVAGSFTPTGSDFLRTDVSTLSIAFPLAGPRTNVSGTPADGDFQHPADVGIDAVLQAIGLGGVAWAGGTGWAYVPKIASSASIRIWVAGSSYAFKDVVGSLEINMAPGEVAIATATLSGVLDSQANIAFPTFDYGVQGTVSSPTVQNMTATWGAVRGWTDCTLTVDSQVESVADSNAEGGTRSRQTGRTVNMNMTIRSDDASDVDYEYKNLVGDNPTDAVTAHTGTSAASTPATNWGINVGNLQVTDNLTPDRVGGELTHQLTGQATGQVADSEFSLIFR